MPPARQPRRSTKDLAMEANANSTNNDSVSQEIATSGRPVRKSAGRRDMDPNFVNSTDNINDAIGDLLEENRIIFGGSKNKKIIKRKRARSVTPPLPPLDIVNFPTEEDFKAQEEPIDPYITMASELQPINITFNIPLGFHGPLKVNIDPATLLRLSTPPSTRQHSPLPFTKRQCFGFDQALSTISKLEKPVTPFVGVSPLVARFIRKHGQPRGFCDLPPGKYQLVSQK
jgi:hypothetical protein